ncbi:MAG: hypothetical protein IJ067_09100 [Prevotella sp.]|nr:hypothetical protein [Prevotella sp.]
MPDEPINIERQQAAMRLTSDYLDLLLRQEAEVERIVVQKLADMQPQIEEMVRQQVSKVINKP